MSEFTYTKVLGLMEAYNDVYEPFLTEEYEIQELALEIIENAAYVLFSQGYDVEDVISYFTEATEETIIEDFVNFAEGHVLLESVAVSDEYIEEQFIQLDEKFGSAIKGAGQLVGRGVSAIKGAGQLVGNTTKKMFTAFSKPSSSPQRQPLFVYTNRAVPDPSLSSFNRLPRAAKREELTNMSVHKKTEGLNRGANFVRNQVKKGLIPKATETGLLQKATNYAQRTMQGAKDVVKKIPGANAASRFLRTPAGNLAAKAGGRAFVVGDILHTGKKVFDPKDNIITAVQNTATSFGNIGVPLDKQRKYVGSNPVAVRYNRRIDKAIGQREDQISRNQLFVPTLSQQYQAFKDRGGELAYKAGGGDKQRQLTGDSNVKIQKQGMQNVRRSENTPNTAAGFDSAFADARRLNRKTFKWRGGEYTTQLAHTDLLDLIKGHLINEGYTKTPKGAEVILESMSQGWFDSIMEDLLLNN